MTFRGQKVNYCRLTNVLLKRGVYWLVWSRLSPPSALPNTPSHYQFVRIRLERLIGEVEDTMHIQALFSFLVVL